MPQHTSPKRYETSRWRLMIGLCGAPAAWVALMSVSTVITTYACYPHRSPLPVPLWGGIHLWLLSASFICMIAGLCSGLIVYKDWRKTRHEAGDKKHVVETGEGRARFLVMLGLMSNGLFIGAIILTACAIWMVPPCKPWS